MTNHQIAMIALLIGPTQIDWEKHFGADHAQSK